MVEHRTDERILEDWRAAERELARAPEPRWLAIMARIDQLQAEYREAIAAREALAQELAETA